MTSMRLQAVGDVLLWIRNEKKPFALIQDQFRQKDLLFGNLETVLSESGDPSQKRWVNTTPPEAGDYLKDAGFDILSLANNHTLDMGREGFEKTLEGLESRDIAYIGGVRGDEPPAGLVVERNGIRLGFLGYTSGRFRSPPGVTVSKLKKKAIINDIRALKGRCDHIVVSLHWGIENTYYPSPDQTRLAHALIDSGATLILGHHSHTIQGLERYNGGLIAYSLGNFQFDTEIFKEKINSTMILSVDFDRHGIRGYTVTPGVINSDFQPEVAKGQTREKVQRWIARCSDRVQNGEVTRQWWFEQISEDYLAYNLESYRYRIRQHGFAPLAECGVWLVTPFCLNCYAGLIRRRLRGRNTGGDA
ncbi:MULTISPECIES: CapA family protein [unclassified Methanoculleus]|uniref:CapA family protein n=1 Tax=unclassified Methanoculleus TaxID=2619537 RepID=UPI0025CC69A2|nr:MULTISPECIES: CapA family protein [unclassified Methanoculleus]MCK9297355.1 CapA family protein [Methanoculleus sp.]MDD2253381.1 CapA family protein [Methanoculleus sp.]MDD2788393.1 CapA family protein [Methanoculleus sp.]MDD3216367.1 CapA family protein [Methanoculleus sp.]MDD4314351.1 CapA family protein [Methanoculleus sp.]